MKTPSHPRGEDILGIAPVFVRMEVAISEKERAFVRMEVAIPEKARVFVRMERAFVRMGVAILEKERAFLRMDVVIPEKERAFLRMAATLRAANGEIDALPKNFLAKTSASPPERRESERSTRRSNRLRRAWAHCPRGESRSERPRKREESIMNPPNKSTRSDRNRQAIAGIKQNLAGTPALVIGGVSYAPADIQAALQASIDAADATTAATAAFHKAVAAEKATHAKGDALYRGLSTVLKNQYGSQADTLAAFGIALPPQRQTPSATTAADAVAKRAATRVARHTMGKRQKAGIKGQVPETPAPTAPSPVTTASTGTTLRP